MLNAAARLFGVFLGHRVYGSQRSWAEALSGNQPFWQINFLLLLLVSGTRNYDRRLSQILHSDLHWLDMADRVRYKLGVTVYRCLHNKAPQYLVDCRVPVSNIASRQRPCSARRCLLTVPRHRLPL